MISNIKMYIAIFVGIVIISLASYSVIITKENKKNIELREIYKSNYEAQVIQTTKWYIDDSIQSAKLQEITLSKKELLESRDKSIQDLVAYNKKLGNKIKQLEYALSVALNSNADTTVPITHDTITIQGKPVVRELDSLTIGKPNIKRIHVVGTDSAQYSVIYNPTLYGYISWYKEGKWKFKNIFKPRNVIYQAEITSDDKFINIDKVLLIRKRK